MKKTSYIVFALVLAGIIASAIFGLGMGNQANRKDVVVTIDNNRGRNIMTLALDTFSTLHFASDFSNYNPIDSVTIISVTESDSVTVPEVRFNEALEPMLHFLSDSAGILRVDMDFRSFVDNPADSDKIIDIDLAEDIELAFVLPRGMLNKVVLDDVVARGMDCGLYFNGISGGYMEIFGGKRVTLTGCEITSIGIQPRYEYAVRQIKDAFQYLSSSSYSLTMLDSHAVSVNYSGLKNGAELYTDICSAVGTVRVDSIPEGYRFSLDIDNADIGELVVPGKGSVNIYSQSPFRMTKSRPQISD